MAKAKKTFKMDAQGNVDVDQFLDEMDRLYKPRTHCCYCTPGPKCGPEFPQPHPAFNGQLLHSQRPNCKCKPENYVLAKNDKVDQDHQS
ncbi:MAG TPA: hypothetical protein VKM55_29570 [Candidatus Lokiarchaeia archaeon]|nr:hypothetical protein [Candidatus Lokiarchaeia archaeon]